MGLGSVRFPTRLETAVTIFAPGVAMRPQDDYVICIVGGRHEFFPESLKSASGVDLQKIAADTLSAWPDQAASVIRAGDASTFFLVEMYTSVPCSLEPPTNVTLLGDAIHAMTPTLGRGADVAMRGGALLGSELRKVAANKGRLQDVLSIYERDMLEYGFAFIRQAAETGRQRMAQNSLPV